MRPAQPGTTADVSTSKHAHCPKPTPYRVTFEYSHHTFIASASAYTQQGAIDLAAELLRGEDGFEPEFARVVLVEVV